MKIAVTVMDIQGIYKQQYLNNNDFSAEGKGKEKAAADISSELAQIAILPSKAAQKRQLTRMIECFSGALDDTDPVYSAKNTALREAVADLQKINTFTVISR